MAECSLDLIFLIRDRLFFFWLGGGGGGGGGGADFFQKLNLDFLYRKSKSIFFVIQSSTIAINPLYTCLTSVSSNKYISDQHSYKNELII